LPPEYVLGQEVGAPPDDVALAGGVTDLVTSALVADVLTADAGLVGQRTEIGG
jgi:hypothetical protein